MQHHKDGSENRGGVMKYKSWTMLFGGTLILLASIQATPDIVVNATSSFSDGQIEFIPDTLTHKPEDPDNPDPLVPVRPIDYTKPNGEPIIGDAGPLSIDFASSLIFGLNEISNQDKVYFARAQSYRDIPDRPNNVQITDSRGTHSGWILSVKQGGQFTSKIATKNDELTGAQITLKKPKVRSNSLDNPPIANAEILLDPNASDSLVMSAEKGAGSGTWLISWGVVEQVAEITQFGEQTNVNVTKDIMLEVPGTTPKDAVVYQTRLIWTLSDVPN